MAQSEAVKKAVEISLTEVFKHEKSGDEAAQLLKECVGDREALEKLFLRFRSDVFAFSLSLYSNRTIAEDCVQETFIRLPSAAKGFKGGSAAAFILGVAKNVSRELYRSEVRFRAGAAAIEEQTPISAAPQTGVLELVRELPRKYRTVVMLHIFSGMTFKTAARVLNIPESTAKSRYSRAIGMLAARMTESDSNNGQQKG